MRRPLKTVETIYETLTPAFSGPAYKRMDDYINRQLSTLEPISAQRPRPRSVHASERLNEQIAAAFSRYSKAFADYVD